MLTEYLSLGKCVDMKMFPQQYHVCSQLCWKNILFTTEEYQTITNFSVDESIAAAGSIYVE